jgi:hypothetical protein
VPNACEDNGAEIGVEIADVCLNCKPVPGEPSAPRTVRLTANGVACTGTFEYLPNEQRYQLISADLERLYRYEEGSRPGNLVTYLNANQAFLVVRKVRTQSIPKVVSMIRGSNSAPLSIPMRSVSRS